MLWLGFATWRQTSARYMAYRHELAQAVLMGTHGKATKPTPLPPRSALRQISIHCWTFGDKTMISAVGVFEEEGQTTRHNLGADVLDYKVMDLPSLGQVVWCLGDEVRQAWRELSSPKQ